MHGLDGDLGLGEEAVDQILHEPDVGVLHVLVGVPEVGLPPSRHRSRSKGLHGCKQSLFDPLLVLNESLLGGLVVDDKQQVDIFQLNQHLGIVIEERPPGHHQMHSSNTAMMQLERKTKVVDNLRLESELGETEVSTP